MTDTYKCQLRESPLEVSPQPSRGDPYERLARIHAVLPIHPLPHFQQGGALLRSLSRDCRDYWQQLRPRHLLPDQLRHGGGGD
jgi:hypothetical protein